jgi:hypothetical protein
MSPSTARFALLALLVLTPLVPPCPSRGDTYSNTTSVLDAAGQWSSGGAYSNLSAAGQPGGIFVSLGGGYFNQAGFLQTFCLQPALDTDRDGLANETDPDNDNDALLDTVELGGTAFTPLTPTDVNRPDTDGDGMNDGEEAVAGTDPLNPNATLHIVQVSRNGADVDVAWVARSNVTYRVMRQDDARWANAWQTGATVTVVSPGNGPWQAVTNAWTDVGPTATNRFYRIDVAP